MKTVKLITVGLLFLTTFHTMAQMAKPVTIGSTPSWEPSVNATVEYYYLPDIATYYDIRTTQFIFISNGKWIRSSHLPRRYHNYDWQHSRKLALLDYHGKQPYTFFKTNKERPTTSNKSKNEPSRNVGMSTRRYEDYRGGFPREKKVD